MLELPYGGWLAPNIYYLGRAGAVQFGGARFVGMSGIYKANDYRRGIWEHPPATSPATGLRSAYHIREFDSFRLKQLSGDISAGISHDWPTGIPDHGNWRDLTRRKPHLASEVKSGELGSPPAREVLDLLQPKEWFSAHLHTRFAAVVHHPEAEGQTRFLALDKPGPKRRFLEVVDLPRQEEAPLDFHFDPEWLAVLKANHPFTPTSRELARLPKGGDWRAMAEEARSQCRPFVDARLKEFGRAIPPLASFSDGREAEFEPAFGTGNPQTRFLHRLLHLEPLWMRPSQPAKCSNPEEVDID